MLVALVIEVEQLLTANTIACECRIAITYMLLHAQLLLMFKTLVKLSFQFRFCAAESLKKFAFKSFSLTEPVNSCLVFVILADSLAVMINSFGNNNKITFQYFLKI